MPVIQGPTIVPGKTISAWVPTDGIANIAIGIIGKGAKIQYDFGSAQIYDVAPQNFNNDGAIVAKANQVRIANTSNKDIVFEVFS